ncbi:MAG: class I SAM-dependent methyltransferase [Candidatus Caenarcaniphilales bacterium]|nr:class I SAM-dependent methyltransferase [Candidatus Caenarcaniphilales bacterium]
MDESIAFFVLAVWIICSLFFLWLFCFTELSYWGNRGLKNIYNLFAPIYEYKWNSAKYKSKTVTEKLFLLPLKMALLNNNKPPRFLDLACGTGRMSLMVLKQEWFSGTIESVDFSKGMLEKLKRELAKCPQDKKNSCKTTEMELSSWTENVKNSYDAVALMEVSEFLPNFPEILSRVAKIIEPGGLLLLTKPPDWMSVFYPKRKQNRHELTELLKNNGFGNISIHKWTHRYEVVHAWKVSGPDISSV